LTQNFGGGHTHPPMNLTSLPMNIFKSFFAGLVVAAVAPVFAATTINFDDLPSDQFIANGYNGLNWTFADVYNARDNPDNLGPSGYKDVANGVQSWVSSPNVAFNGSIEGDPNPGSNPITISSNTPFSLNSVWLHSVWNNGLNVEVKGFLGGLAVPGADTNVLLNASDTAPTLATFGLNFSVVDSVEFIPSGGTQYYTYFHGTYFAMDDLTVDLTPLSAVPEPGTWVAAVLALAAIAFSQQDRLSRAKPIRG